MDKEIDSSDLFLFKSKSDISFFIRRSPHTTHKLKSATNPVCIYFTASWKESLLHPELSRLTSYLLENGIDVIACDLPYHPAGQVKYDEAIEEMKKQARLGKSIMGPFARDLSSALIEMSSLGIISLESFAFAGLSRGAFAALHLKSHIAHAHTMHNRPSASYPIALLAPLLTLSSESRTGEEPDCIYKALFPLKSEASPLFLSIGNNDSRVDTQKSIAFYQHYVKEALLFHHSDRKKTVPATLHIHPSIGFMGHGTPDLVFKIAAEWIARTLNREQIQMK